jgi:hypothetical protein
MPTSVRRFGREVAWTLWRWYGPRAVTRKTFWAVSYAMSSEAALERASILVPQEASAGRHSLSLAYCAKCDRLLSSWKYWKRSLCMDVNDSWTCQLGQRQIEPPVTHGRGRAGNISKNAIQCRAQLISSGVSAL